MDDHDISIETYYEIDFHQDERLTRWGWYCHDCDTAESGFRAEEELHEDMRRHRGAIARGTD